MLVLIGWAIWSGVAVLTLCYWVDIFFSITTHRSLTYALVFQAGLLTLLLIATVVVRGLDKCHLLWITPVVFVVGILLSPSSHRAD